MAPYEIARRPPALDGPSRTVPVVLKPVYSTPADAGNRSPIPLVDEDDDERLLLEEDRLLELLSVLVLLDSELDEESELVLLDRLEVLLDEELESELVLLDETLLVLELESSDCELSVELLLSELVLLELTLLVELLDSSDCEDSELEELRLDVLEELMLLVEEDDRLEELERLEVDDDERLLSDERLDVLLELTLLVELLDSSDCDDRELDEDRLDVLDEEMLLVEDDDRVDVLLEELSSSPEVTRKNVGRVQFRVVGRPARDSTKSCHASAGDKTRDHTGTSSMYAPQGNPLLAPMFVTALAGASIAVAVSDVSIPLT